MDLSHIYTIERYENASEYITHYLASEGRKTGKVERLFHAEPLEGPRPKGRKRRDQVHTYLFSTPSLEILAQEIARAGNTVSRDFMVVLSDVKRLRHECTS